MKLISYLYRQSWKLLLLAAFSGLVAGISGAALVVIISKGVASAGSLSLPTLAGLFFGTALLHLATKTTTEISLLHLTQTAIYQLRLDLSRKVLTTPQKNLQELGKPGLLVMLTKDIDNFTEAFVWLPIGFGNFVITIACFSYLAWLSLPAFLMLVVFLTSGIFAFFVVERHPRGQLMKVREQMDKLYEHFRNLIEGSKELQLNAQRGELFVEKVIAVEANEYRSAFTSGMTGYNMAVNVGAILFFVMIGIFLFLVPQLRPQSAEVTATTIFTLLYLVRPISELVFSIPVVRQAGIALERLQQLDRDLAEVADPSIAIASASPERTLTADGAWTLELRNIRHHYPSSNDDSQFVLGPLDLSIRQGEILYIVGGNGSGKTTLAMLILGLYRPDEGTISLNGTPVTETNIDAYRQNFAAVFSDFHLFEHLLDGDQASLSERARHYIEALGMTHKVKVVDGKFSTISLSTGQRKRLALVSAYLEDRPIYLFDEWAADQDPVFKRVFYTELLPELKSRGKTVIVITHDDAYFGCADRVIKLEDGHQGRVASPTQSTDRDAGHSQPQPQPS